MTKKKGAKTVKGHNLEKGGELLSTQNKILEDIVENSTHVQIENLRQGRTQISVPLRHSSMNNIDILQSLQLYFPKYISNVRTIVDFPKKGTNTYEIFWTGNVMKKGGKPPKADWIQKATKKMEEKGTVGAFTAKAKKRRLDSMEFARKVMKNPHYYDQETVDQARFVHNINSDIRENGGALEKEFKFDKNFVIYVPSTSDVGSKISQTDLDIRVKRVEEYVADTFGGYTETETEGGYKATDGQIIEEDVVKVSVFSKDSDWKQNEKKVVNQIKKWATEWGQEAIGFEYEGDLYYIDEDGKFEKGGRFKLFRGGEVERYNKWKSIDWDSFKIDSKKRSNIYRLLGWNSSDRIDWSKMPEEDKEWFEDDFMYELNNESTLEYIFGDKIEALEEEYELLTDHEDLEDLEDIKKINTTEKKLLATDEFKDLREGLNEYGLSLKDLGTKSRDELVELASEGKSTDWVVDHFLLNDDNWLDFDYVFDDSEHLNDLYNSVLEKGAVFTEEEEEQQFDLFQEKEMPKEKNRTEKFKEKLKDIREEEIQEEIEKGKGAKSEKPKETDETTLVKEINAELEILNDLLDDAKDEKNKELISELEDRIEFLEDLKEETEPSEPSKPNESIEPIQKDINISETILEQLGGNKFLVMTGAKNLVKSDKEKWLSFRIGRNKSKANLVKIQLLSTDTYKVTFGRVHGMNYRDLDVFINIYGDQLRDIFTDYTGLYTKLEKGGLTPIEHRIEADKWAKEISNPTELSKGMNVTEIDEKQSHHYRLSELRDKAGESISKFSEIIIIFNNKYTPIRLDFYGGSDGKPTEQIGWSDSKLYLKGTNVLNLQSVHLVPKYDNSENYNKIVSLIKRDMRDKAGKTELIIDNPRY